MILHCSYKSWGLAVAVAGCIAFGPAPANADDMPVKGVAGPRPTIAVIADPATESPAKATELVEMMRQRLSATGAFSVVDNTHRQALLNEQMVAAAGQVTPSTEARLGRKLGVNYLVVMRIDKFNASNEQRQDVLSILSKTTSFVTKMSLSDRLQIVDIKTGEIMQSLEDARDSTSSPASSTNQTFINDAPSRMLSASADALVEKIDRTRFVNSAPVEVVSGRVIDVSGAVVTISIGSEAGISIGRMVDFFDSRTILNPDTHKTIQTMVKRGSLQITQVEKGYSIGIPLSTSVKPIKMQIVRLSAE